MKGKKLFSFVDVTDETAIQKLSFAEQLRVLIKRLSDDGKEQLKAEDAETVYLLQLKADLNEFLYKATEKVRRGDHRSVTIAISSKFLPVLEEVMSSPTITSYYNVQMDIPDVEFDIQYYIHATLEVKSY